MSPSLRDVIWEAARGARGWFLAVLGVGCLLILFGHLMGAASLSRAYAYALLMPFWLAALMGTVAVWSYRTRQRWPILSPVGRKVFGGAALWNFALIAMASAVEQVLTRAGALDRAPRGITEAVVGPVVLGSALALLVALPRER